MDPRSTSTRIIAPGRRLAWPDILSALGAGYGTFRRIPAVSIAYAAVFAMPGLLLLTAVGLFGLSPMALPFAGGFMLVGPVLLTGYFEFERQRLTGVTPRFSDALRAFRRAPPSLWLVALICAFLFLIWITDAAVLYSFMIGGVHLPYEIAPIIGEGERVLRFELWGSLMGAVIAFLIFAISAFSVPLIFEYRVNVVEAVHISVRTVFRNLPVCLGWGLILGSVIMLSILLLPLLLFVLPVMSYASFALYRSAFPDHAALPSA